MHHAQPPETRGQPPQHPSEPPPLPRPRRRLLIPFDATGRPPFRHRLSAHARDALPHGADDGGGGAADRVVPPLALPRLVQRALSSSRSISAAEGSAVELEGDTASAPAFAGGSEIGAGAHDAASPRASARVCEGGVGG